MNDMICDDIRYLHAEIERLTAERDAAIARADLLAAECRAWREFDTAAVKARWNKTPAWRERLDILNVATAATDAAKALGECDRERTPP